VLHNLYDTYRAQLWGPYGFKDAFNLTANWWDTDYLGIDQGPVIIMIENHLNSRVWNRIKQNADVQRGLQHAGFVLAADVVENGTFDSLDELRLELTPNPFRGRGTFAYRIPETGHVTLVLADVAGREVARLVDGQQSAGEHFVTLAAEALPSGAYFSKLQFDGRAVLKRCVLVR
jgi:hypothetical protein